MAQVGYWPAACQWLLLAQSVDGLCSGSLFIRSAARALRYANTVTKPRVPKERTVIKVPIVISMIADELITGTRRDRMRIISEIQWYTLVCALKDLAFQSFARRCVKLTHANKKGLQRSEKTRRTPANPDWPR